jgi:hypothetical protein
MEVICREYKRCEFKYHCEHAKNHSVIKGKYPHANDCITTKRENLPCYCSCIDIRKEKLNKLKNESR